MNLLRGQDWMAIIRSEPAVGIRLVRTMRRGRWKRSGSLVRRALEPLLSTDYLHELIIERPGAAVEVIEFFREAGAKPLTAPILGKLLDRLDPRALASVVYRNPLAGAQVVRLLWALTLGRTTPEDGWLDQFVNPADVVKLIGDHGEASAELLHLIIRFEPSRWSAECLARLSDSEPPGLHGLLLGLPIASSGEFVGDGEHQRAVSVRNRRNFRQVESNDLC